MLIVATIAGHEKVEINPATKLSRAIQGDKGIPSLALSTSCTFSATLGFIGNFQLVEQLSMHRATSRFLCLYSHSHAPATSETIKKCRI